MGAADQAKSGGCAPGRVILCSSHSRRFDGTIPLMVRVAIVGRPNVGKSALFNRLLRRTVSIVHDQPGVTRDRISAVVLREKRKFEFVDTGGIGLFESDTTPAAIARAVQMQAQIAIESADLVLLVVDGREGLRPLDREISTRLRRSGRKTWLVVNKLDLPMHDVGAAEFAELGFEPTLHVSASHGRGISSVWEALQKVEDRSAGVRPDDHAAPATADIHAAEGPRIAIVGRPNVGKSSLVNRLLQGERVIVSETPGTTRDSIELPVEFHGVRYTLVDTAGIRQKTRIRSSVEMYSRHWTEKSIIRSDMVLLMLSAAEGGTRQDREIAGLIQKHQKPGIILVNKWDLNETMDSSKTGEGRTFRRRHHTSRSEYEKALRMRMPFLHHAPVLFISSLQGYHALAVWREIARIEEERRTVFTTGVLNRFLSRAQARLPAPMRHGKRLRIYYAIQKLGAPVPTFVLFVNQAGLFSEGYGRYLQNQLRKEQPMTGCPIVFHLRSRSQTDRGAPPASLVEESAELSS